MSKLLPPIDHITQGLARTISQYRGKAQFNILTACYLQQIQYLEDEIHRVVAAWDLDTATGFRLRILGSLVGQPNISADDEVQRLFIKARVRVNQSRGRIPDLLAVADLLIPGYQYYELSQYVWFDVKASGMTYPKSDAIHKMLKAAAPAGVRVGLNWNIFTDPFILAQTGELEVDQPNGLSDSSPYDLPHAGSTSAGF